MPPCIVKSCKNNSDISVLGISYHTFSKQLWKDWLKALKLLPHEVYKNSIICSEHFKPTDFITWNRYKTYRRLQRFAVPSKYLDEKEIKNTEESFNELVEIKIEPSDYNVNTIQNCDKENDINSNMNSSLHADKIFTVDKFEAEETSINNLLNTKDVIDSNCKIFDVFVNSKDIKEETDNVNSIINDSQKTHESFDSNYVDIPDAIMIEGEMPGNNFKVGIDSNNFRIVNINKLLKNPIRSEIDTIDPKKEIQVLKKSSLKSSNLKKDLKTGCDKISGVKKKTYSLNIKRTLEIAGFPNVVKKRKISSKKEGKSSVNINLIKNVKNGSVQQKTLKDLFENPNLQRIVQIGEIEANPKPKLTEYKGLRMHNRKIKSENVKLKKVKAAKLLNEQKSVSPSVSRNTLDSPPTEFYEAEMSNFKKLLEKHASNGDNDNIQNIVESPVSNNEFLVDKSILRQALLHMAKALDKSDEKSSKNDNNKVKHSIATNSNKKNIKLRVVDSNEILPKSPMKRNLNSRKKNLPPSPSNIITRKKSHFNQQEILKDIAVHHNYCLNPENLASEIHGLKERLKVKENMYKIVSDIQSQLVGEVKDLNDALSILEAKYDEWIVRLFSKSG